MTLIPYVMATDLPVSNKICNCVPFFCFAISEKDEQRCNEILASLTAYLRSLPFNFHNASIITGQEEGLYGWVTVNYLMGNFLEVRHCHGSICRSTCTYPFKGEKKNTASQTGPSHGSSYTNLSPYFCRKTFGIPMYTQKGKIL